MISNLLDIFFIYHRAKKKEGFFMNKKRLLKDIEELKNNIKSDLDNHERIKLYVDSWVIGALDMIVEKCNGGFNYYPYNATYKYLFNEFFNYFICLHIVPEIKKECYQYLNTYKNIAIVDDMARIING